VETDQGQVVCRRRRSAVRGLSSLGPDQHRVEAGDEEEEADPETGYWMPTTLVIGAEPESSGPDTSLRVFFGCGSGSRPSIRVSGYRAKPRADEEGSRPRQTGSRASARRRSGFGVFEEVELVGVDLVAQPPAENRSRRCPGRCRRGRFESDSGRRQRGPGNRFAHPPPPFPVRGSIESSTSAGLWWPGANTRLLLFDPFAEGAFADPPDRCRNM